MDQVAVHVEERAPGPAATTCRVQILSSRRVSRHREAIVRLARAARGAAGLDRSEALCDSPGLESMKIIAVDSAVLAVPHPEPMALEFREHRLVVAHVHTDEGVSGLGYSLAFGGGGAESIQVYLETRLAPLLVGEDPRLVERLWERMYRADRGIRRLGVAAYALSALDIALWDLVGQGGGPAALPPLGRRHGPRRGLRERRLAVVPGGGHDRGGAALRRGGPPLLQAQGPPPRPAGEPPARRGGAAGARRRRPAHGRRQPEARRAGKPPAGRGARGSRPRLVRGARAGRRHRRLRRGRPRDPHPGGDRREPLHALRVPRAVRAAGRPVPHARRLPGERLQRDAQDRPPRGGAPAPGLAPRRPRAVGPRRGRALERLPRRVHGLDAARPLRGRAAARSGRRPDPDPRPAGPRHGARARAPSGSTASAERSRGRRRRGPAPPGRSLGRSGRERGGGRPPRRAALPRSDPGRAPPGRRP